MEAIVGTLAHAVLTDGKQSRQQTPWMPERMIPMKSNDHIRERRLRFSPALCRELLRSRYAQPGERGIADIRHRVARALASVESPSKALHWTQQFESAMQCGFLPGGRINAAAGTDLQATLINCFVQPLAPQRTGRDESGRPGLALALEESAITMRMGGGVGVDLSALPSVRQPAAEAGLDPVSVILTMESRGQRLATVGTRRAAQMALVSIDHPDSRAVIDLKRHHRLQTVTLSVVIPDAFMVSLDRQDAGGRAARASWQVLLRAAWDTGSPGVVFIDKVNRDNNLSDIEHLGACNPCGEQFLPDYGACDLGSIDLTRLVRHPFRADARFDFDALARLVPVAVRALDNVISLTHWPLPQQAQAARMTRRIGLGVTGLADALIMLGVRYDRAPGRAMAATLVRALRNHAYRASVDLAIERGPFPNCNPSQLLRPPHFASRLPAWLKHRIARHGLRNSHLLAIAPTGTISIALAGNVSSGVEPVFAARSRRWVRLAGTMPSQRTVEDYAWRLYRSNYPGDRSLPPAWCDASSIRAIDHLRMVAALSAADRLVDQQDRQSLPTGIDR